MQFHDVKLESNSGWRKLKSLNMRHSKLSLLEGTEVVVKTKTNQIQVRPVQGCSGKRKVLEKSVVC